MNYKHGNARVGKHSRVYGIWRDMLKRCNPNNVGSKTHGKRGITVCEIWRDFANFFADMGHPPTDRHSIGRINNNGHYELDNCRWETAKQQANNRRSSRLVNVGGKLITVSQAADALRIGYHEAYYDLITKPKLAKFERHA